MSRYLAFLAVAVVATISFLGFQGKTSKDTPVYVFDDMDYQNKYKAQGENALFADGRDARPPVAGTVARIPDEIGQTRLGRKSGAKNLTDKSGTGKLTDAELFRTIEAGRRDDKGRERMAGFGNDLSPAEITALVAYVRRFSQ
jgi:hypothetical protein